MLNTEMSEPVYSFDDRPQLSAPDVLTRVVYISRAARGFARKDLSRLIRRARVKNRRWGVTGLLAFDWEHFLQWLEGPRDVIAHLMQTIAADERHHDVEVLEEQSTSARAFPFWHMALATPDAARLGQRLQPYQASAGLLAAIRHPGPNAVSGLADFGRALGEATERLWGPAGARGPDPRSLVERIVRDEVVPELMARAPADVRATLAGASAVLARLLLAQDLPGAERLILRTCGGFAVKLHAHVALFEGAARRLGDLWRIDACSQADIAMALAQLQILLRRLHVRARPRPGLATSPAVLVASAPGETDLLEAVLDTEVLWQSGWGPRTEFPRSDLALQQLVAKSWFDVLDLSLSSVHRREDALPQVRRTIEQARRASLNPRLAVMISGRGPAEEARVGFETGADSVSPSASEAGLAAATAIRRRANEPSRRPGN